MPKRSSRHRARRSGSVRKSGRPTLGGLQSACVLVTAVVCVWAAITPTLGTEATRAGATMAAAIDAWRAGDLRAAIRDADRVLEIAPRSSRAMALKACALWQLRYQDHAVIAWQTAVTAGVQPERPPFSPCFAERLREHSLRLLRLGDRFYLYPTPSSRQSRAAERAAFIAERERRPVDALIALSCVAVLEGLPALAGLHFGYGEILGAATLAPKPVRRCLKGPLRRAIVMVEGRGGVLLFVPRDRKKRLFDPLSSPLKPRVPPPLP